MRYQITRQTVFKWFRNPPGRKRPYIRTGSFVLMCLTIIWFTFCLPDPLFNDPCSTLLTDQDHRLLGAKIASDGQWRFPPGDSVPEKFKQAVLYFEDEYFRYHPGINPVSMLKAFWQNLKAGKVVRGGSTISLQVIRMSRKGKPRNVGQKLIECILVLRLELTCSKEEILGMYTSNAPFGGNVVGLEAASWRYYGRSPFRLSWGETATLAVLPNAPSLIYPGKRQQALLKKRNRLLNKLHQKGILDQMSCNLAKEEPLPQKPENLPRYAPHLIERAVREGLEGKRVHTSLNKSLQIKTERIINKYQKYLKQTEIHNAAALVIEVESGNTLAYVGNSAGTGDEEGNQVDIIMAERSSGSILKPLLYALMLKEGYILPATLVADVPTQIAGYSPKNFDKKYDGAVPADQALARSLNIPAIRMLREYGVDAFHARLPDFNLSTITRPADHYGLSLILGGAEVRLWELVGIYGSMARMLNHYGKNMSLYDANDYRLPSYSNTGDTKRETRSRETDLLGAGPVWHTFEALSEMDRPVEGAHWNRYNSSQKIAWKTGTSFGHRDAWAVGVTPKYVVGVWTGNADGEGRPGLTGAGTAAPVMFEIHKLLEDAGWFPMPYDDLTPLAICAQSGHKASPVCETADTVYVPVAGERTPLCPYHRKVQLNREETFQVTSDCHRVSEMKFKVWFVLPPVMEWYYKNNNPFYTPLPPMHPDCAPDSRGNMELIYPKPNARVFIPKGLDETRESLIFEAVHRIPDTKLYWHLDEEYLGQTSAIHRMEVQTHEGFHTLILVAETGEQIIRKFEVIGR